MRQDWHVLPPLGAGSWLLLAGLLLLLLLGLQPSLQYLCRAVGHGSPHVAQALLALAAGVLLLLVVALALGVELLLLGLQPSLQYVCRAVGHGLPQLTQALTLLAGLELLLAAALAPGLELPLLAVLARALQPSLQYVCLAVGFRTPQITQSLTMSAANVSGVGGGQPAACSLEAPCDRQTG